MPHGQLGRRAPRSPADVCSTSRPYRDPTWTETNWFGFFVPEATLRGSVYVLFRTNLGIARVAVLVYSRPAVGARHRLRRRPGSHVPIPPGDLDDYRLWPMGWRCSMTTPLEEWTVRYEGRSGTVFDLVLAAHSPPIATAESRLDGAGPGYAVFNRDAPDAGAPRATSTRPCGSPVRSASRGHRARGGLPVEPRPLLEPSAGVGTQHLRQLRRGPFRTRPQLPRADSQRSPRGGQRDPRLRRSCRVNRRPLGGRRGTTGTTAGGSSGSSTSSRTPRALVSARGDARRVDLGPFGRLVLRHRRGALELGRRRRLGRLQVALGSVPHARALAKVLGVRSLGIAPARSAEQPHRMDHAGTRARGAEPR